MGYNIELQGFLGILILLATVGVLILITPFFFSVYKLGKDNSGKNSEIAWSKHFFLSGIVFLTIDVFFGASILTAGGGTITKEIGDLFDNRMLYIWIPFHILGYFLVASTLRYSRLHKKKINDLLNKIR